MVHSSLTLFLFIVVIAEWNLVIICISSASCSRSGNSLVLVHCLTHRSCSLFLCFRVEFYIPIKWVAKSKLTVNRGSFLAKFCHLSWVCGQYPNPGLGTGFSVLQKWLGLSLMLIFETSGTALLCNKGVLRTFAEALSTPSLSFEQLSWSCAEILDLASVEKSTSFWVWTLWTKVKRSQHYGSSIHLHFTCFKVRLLFTKGRLVHYPGATLHPLLWIFWGLLWSSKCVILQHASILESFLVLVDVEGSGRQRWFLGALKKKIVCLVKTSDFSYCNRGVN